MSETTTRYRKKPIEVQAIQFTGDNVTEIWETFGWEGIVDDAPGQLILTTTHGDPAPCRVGDWIIPDSKPGTFYPCKPDVFAATYEPVGDGKSRLDEVREAIRSTREYQAGIAFGVPPEAHEDFLTAIARAAVEAAGQDRRTGDRLAAILRNG